MNTSPPLLPDTNAKMLATLKQIATIVHSGGLVGLDQFDALNAVRQLTLEYWDNKLEIITVSNLNASNFY